MREQALVEAEAKAMILLDRNMATRDYFTDKLKPAVFALSERTKAGLIAEDDAHLGEKIQLATGREFEDLACTFNTTPENLRHQRDRLEEVVQKRTKELTEALGNVKMLAGLGLHGIMNAGMDKPPEHDA